MPIRGGARDPPVCMLPIYPGPYEGLRSRPCPPAAPVLGGWALWLLKWVVTLQWIAIIGDDFQERSKVWHKAFEVQSLR